MSLGTCVWVVGNYNVCNMFEAQWCKRLTLPEANREAEEATERETYFKKKKKRTSHLEKSSGLDPSGFELKFRHKTFSL